MPPKRAHRGRNNTSGGSSSPAQAIGSSVGSPTVPPSVMSPTASLQREQQLMQQQIYQHQLQLLRMAQQQKTDFPLGEAIRTGLVFIVALVGTYTVFEVYGWPMAVAAVALLYVSGMFRFAAVMARYLFKTVDSVKYNEALRRADIMPDPNLRKTTKSGENGMLAFGCSSMQGWRRTMEDAHTMLTFEDGGFFAVYDGHSGAATSRFCGGNLYQFVANTEAFKVENYPTALYDGFIAIDRHLLNTHGADRSGCTAVALYVKGDDLFCANAGDSRCVLCRDGEPFPLSNDHKPYLPMEQARIERAGGYVFSRRVNGILALSRAIGDFGFKQNGQVSWDQQAVTSAPEVRTTRLNRDKDEFAVVACDGIWDVLTNEQVIEFVRPRVQQRVPLGRICEQLMEACLSPQPFVLGCDNMSVIIVQFKRNAPGIAAVGSASTTAPVGAGGGGGGAGGGGWGSTDSSPEAVMLGDSSPASSSGSGAGVGNGAAAAQGEKSGDLQALLSPSESNHSPRVYPGAPITTVRALTVSSPADQLVPDVAAGTSGGADVQLPRSQHAGDAAHPSVQHNADASKGPHGGVDYVVPMPPFTEPSSDPSSPASSLTSGHTLTESSRSSLKPPASLPPSKNSSLAGAASGTQSRRRSSPPHLGTGGASAPGDKRSSGFLPSGSTSPRPSPTFPADGAPAAEAWRSEKHSSTSSSTTEMSQLKKAVTKGLQ